MNFTPQEKKRVYELARELVGMHHEDHEKGILPLQVWKRMQDTVPAYATLEQYLKFALADAAERLKLISILTIHTTYWFREKHHFELIEREVRAFTKQYPGKTYRVWCAACSTGEEVYSVALLLESIKRSVLGFNYEILGSDIDKLSLETARKGIYSAEAQPHIATRYHPFLLKGTGKTQGLVAIDKAIRDNCRWAVHNLEEAPQALGKFHLVLCRNVLIYFSAAQIRGIIACLVSTLEPEGHLIVGMSEAISEVPAELRNVENTLYQRRKPAAIAARPKVLFLDDDDDMLTLYEAMMGRLPDFEGLYAHSSAEVEALLKAHAPDLLVFDLNLGSERGDEYLAKLRARGQRAPAFIVSGFGDLNEQTLHRLTTAGVLEIMDKLIVFKERDFLSSKIRTLLAPERRSDAGGGEEKKSELVPGTRAPEVILIGASTGGVQALAELLRDIPADYPPIVIVQHISSKFADSLARQLQRVTGRPFVPLLQEFQELKRGHLFVALDSYHIHLTERGGRRGIQKHHIENDRSQHCPSVDELFHSAVPFASNALAILLTGMGKDGAAGLAALRKNGALTIVQDEASCIVFGMPKEAIKIGAAKLVGNLRQIRKWMDEVV